MKTNQTFSILFWINRNRLTNNEAAIYARLTIDGKRVELSLQRSIKPELWDVKASKAKGSNEPARILNTYLDLVKGNLQRHYNMMLSNDETITAELLKNNYLGISEKKKTLLEVFLYHNKEMKGKIDIDFAIGTYKRYEVTYRKLEKFMRTQYRKSDICISELNYKFITDFEYYLKTNDKLDHNTAMKYIKNVKKIINFALAHEWLLRDPFQSFKCSTNEVVREILNENELAFMAAKKLPSIRLEEVRDMFLFSCYTGYSFSDLVKLTPHHIVIGMDKAKWIITNRTKTESKSNVPLLPVAENLIEKYKSHPECINKGLLFPVKSNQKVNDYLKEIAAICGVNKKLTFHIARHTFATTVTLTNGVPIESVSSMLGHNSIRTTQIYAKVIEKKVSEDMMKLRERLLTNHNILKSNIV